MSLNLNDLMQYKAAKLSNGFLTLPSPEEVLAPAMDKLNPYTNKFSVHVQEPVRQATDEDLEYKIADRVLVEAVIEPDVYRYNNDNYSMVIGMLWAHDVKNPFMKMYLGYENSACLNLSVFNPLDIVQRNFATTDFHLIYESIDKFLSIMQSRKQEMNLAMDFLLGETLSGASFAQEVGKVALKAHNTPAMKSHFSAMVQNLITPSSKYFNKDGEYTRYAMYQAMTDDMPKYDAKVNSPINPMRPEKVLTAYNFFKN